MRRLTASPRSRFEARRYVDIAVRSEILSQRRTEEGEPPDSVRTAEQGKAFSGNRYPRIHTGAAFGSGVWSHVLPSSVRPVFFLNTPPHCLKKNGVRDCTQLSRISRTQSGCIGLAPGPDSPPAMTQSIPVKSTSGKGSNSGSRDRNFVPAPVS